MANTVAVQVTIYLNEADQWHHKPLHMEILNYLRKENVYAATAVHASQDFWDASESRPRTWSKPEAGCR